MGANFQTMRLPLEEAKAEKVFEQAQEDDLYENGHSYSGGFGMASGLKFCLQSFTTDNEASEWLEMNAQKREAALAVRVEEPEPHLLAGAWCSS